MSDRYQMRQSVDFVSIIDVTLLPTGEPGVVQFSRSLGDPRTRLLALELCERLNHRVDVGDRSEVWGTDRPTPWPHVTDTEEDGR